MKVSLNKKASSGMFGTCSVWPINVAQGFSASGWSCTKFQNCRSFISISVTWLSSTQLRNMVSRDCSGSLNIFSGIVFLTDAPLLFMWACEQVTKRDFVVAFDDASQTVNAAES